MKTNPYIEKAVSIVGSQVELARRCGVKQAHVWKWLRMKTIPADRAIAIEQATDGKVSAEDLCPSVNWNYIRGTAKRPVLTSVEIEAA